MTRPLNVLHVYKDYAPVAGGIENHIRALAEAQVAAGHAVTVLVTNPSRLPPYEMINDVRVIRATRIATVASTPLSIQLVAKLRSSKPDITHLHFPYPIGEIAQLVSGKRRPFVLTYHSDIVRQQRLRSLYDPLLMNVLRKSKRIIATSDRYVNSSVYLQSFAGKCTVVPLSVDYQRFSGANALVGRGSRPVALFVGQHRYYKGVDDLLEAILEVDVDLLVGGDGPMRGDWQRLAAELGVEERVRFLGHVADDSLPGLYASADLFVLPSNSRAEAFGKVLLEAMATGLPCITTELGTGTSYVVEHMKTGLVVPPRDPTALAKAMQTILSDDTLRKRMGRRGQARVMREFGPQRMCRMVEDVYRRVLDAPTGVPEM